MQKQLKKLLSLSLALLTAFTLVTYQDVSADAYGNADHFNVTNTTESASSTDGWSYSSNTITISQSGDYTISKACDCDEEEIHSSYSIVIDEGLTVNLTIEDIKIENTSGAAMDIDGSSTVVLTFKGDNSFTSSNNYAGIQFNNADLLGGSLEITSDSEENTLTAIGSGDAAGIGCTSGSNYAAYITISGGTVIAYGGDNGGAGIGSGSGYYAGVYDIIITGGTVYAYGGEDGGAGIGGGLYSSDIKITITGGTIYAEAGSDTAEAIGAGASGYSGEVTLTIGDCETVKYKYDSNVDRIFTSENFYPNTITTSDRIVSFTFDPTTESPSETEPSVESEENSSSTESSVESTENSSSSVIIVDTSTR